MSKQKSEFDILRDDVWSELKGDAPAIARELLSTTLPDARKLNTDDFLSHVHHNWQDVEFRKSLLQRVGPRHFLAIYEQISGARVWPPADILDQIDVDGDQLDAARG